VTPRSCTALTPWTTSRVTVNDDVPGTAAKFWRLLRDQNQMSSVLWIWVYLQSPRWTQLVGLSNTLLQAINCWFDVSHHPACQKLQFRRNLRDYTYVEQNSPNLYAMQQNYCHLIFWNQNCDPAISFKAPIRQMLVGLAECANLAQKLVVMAASLEWSQSEWWLIKL